MTTEAASLDWLPRSITYAEYLGTWHKKLDAPLVTLDKDARKRVFYARYNQERSVRVVASYVPSEELKRAMACVRKRQIWLVLTEDWCVDSAYSLPVLAAAAEMNPLVDLRILPRDQHPDVMDRHLTGGARSIPKLVAFTPAGEQLYEWGPKPAALKALRADLTATGTDPKQILQATVDWYENDGWLPVDTELAQTISAAICAG